MFKFSDQTADKTGQEFYKLANKLYPYAQKELGFKKPCSCVFASDPENAQNPLGYTAYYNPAKSEITIFSDGRHIKDMLRSFSHELVHHAQACRGDLESSQTEDGYAQNDPHLREMEREAYEKGNLIFRDWEDGYKAGLKEEYGKDDYTGATKANGEKNVTYFTSRKMDANAEAHHDADVEGHNQKWDLNNQPYYNKMEEGFLQKKKVTFGDLAKILFPKNYILLLEPDIEEILKQGGLDKFLTLVQWTRSYKVGQTYYNKQVTDKKLSKVLNDNQVSRLRDLMSGSSFYNYNMLGNDHIKYHSDFLKDFKKRFDNSDLKVELNFNNRLVFDKFHLKKKGPVLVFVPSDEEMTVFANIERNIIYSKFFDEESNGDERHYWTGTSWSKDPSKMRKYDDRSETIDAIRNWEKNSLLIPSIDSLSNFPLEEVYKASPVSNEFKEEVVSYLNLEDPDEVSKNWIGTAEWDGGEISYFWVKKNKLFYLIEFSPTYGVDVKNVFSTWYQVQSAGLKILRQHGKDAKVTTFNDKRR